MANNVDVRTSLALSKDAVVVADIGSLLSEAGVPLALSKGNNHVVVLFPTPCCSHHASKSVPQMRHPAAAFDTAEHIITVAGCTLTLAEGRRDTLRTPLGVGRNPHLTYGQIIALGGDFYGDPKHPVCQAGNQDQQIEQFRKNFESLEQASPDEVRKILEITEHYEFDPIAQAVRQGQPPSRVYAGLPTSPPHVVPDEDRAFDEATGGTSLENGRYLNLASTNFDHFGVDAITCYMAGHILAQRDARNAKRSGNPKQLLRAYAINAFADHFLTDLFAAGHMRTPRRALYESASVALLPANLCAKRMHDEDNKFGLWVKNKLGDKWVAYGDARYRDEANAANRRIMKRALQQSMDEVWNAYQTDEVRDHHNSKVLDYLPTIITEITVNPAARDDPQNWAPLFWRDPSGKLWLRSRDPANPAVRDYFEQGWLPWPKQWGLTEVASAIRGLPSYMPPMGGPPHMPPDEYRRAGLPIYPDEAGPSGEFGWPPEPGSVTGSLRVRGATGPNLKDLRSGDWSIDGATGPSSNP
jgi:hypothetical protein